MDLQVPTDVMRDHVRAGYASNEEPASGPPFAPFPSPPSQGFDFSKPNPRARGVVLFPSTDSALHCACKCIADESDCAQLLGGPAPGVVDGGREHNRLKVTPHRDDLACDHVCEVRLEQTCGSGRRGIHLSAPHPLLPPLRCVHQLDEPRNIDIERLQPLDRPRHASLKRPSVSSIQRFLRPVEVVPERSDPLNQAATDVDE